MSYNTKEKPIWNCTMYKQISLKKERISSEMTASNNSLRVVG